MAKDLPDIAAYFDRLGHDSQVKAHRSTGRQRRDFEAEARIWHRAAEILRQTKLEDTDAVGNETELPPRA